MISILDKWINYQSFWFSSTNRSKRYESELKFYKSFYYVLNVIVWETSMKFDLYGDDVCYLSQCVQKC